MNEVPRRVTVTDGRVFLVGGQEVVMVGMGSTDNKDIKIQRLDENEVIDVVPCFTGLN